MVYAVTLSTTSPLSFQSFIKSSTHPSLPQSASTARYALSLALKTHKRLPRGARRDDHLPAVLSALEGYIPYLFAISNGLRGIPVKTDIPIEEISSDISTRSHGLGEEIQITQHTEIESSWKPTLSPSSALNLGSASKSKQGNPTGGKGVRARGKRVSGQGLNFEIAFTLTTLGYVLSRLARRSINETLYASQTQSTEQRVAAIQTATRYLIQASSIHGLLASSGFTATSTESTVPDINATTQSMLASLALAEATLLAVLKDDAYIAVCIQMRNPNDKEWMVKAPEIPKLRALLLARLCVRAAEYAEQAAAGFGSVGSGKNGRLDAEVTRYAGALARVSRARACRFFGIDAELAGKVGEGIAWLRAARIALGLRGAEGSSPAHDNNSGASEKGGFSRLKREWVARREEKKIGKDAGGGGRFEKGPLEPGDDAGRDEEGRVITMLETKWVRMNDTMNTQIIPPPGPLLSNLPSGRDIHTPPAPYQPLSLDEHQLLRMRAPPDDDRDVFMGNDSDDSDEEDIPPDTRGTPGDFSDRSQTASTAYY